MPEVEPDLSKRAEDYRVRRAGPGDAAALSSLAFRSKASWGYDIEFMKRCRQELTYSGDDIEAPRFRFRICEIDGEPALRSPRAGLFLRAGFRESARGFEADRLAPSR